jgi:hypothetical protein
MTIQSGFVSAERKSENATEVIHIPLIIYTNSMKKAVKKDKVEENDFSRSSDLLKRVRISYLVTSSLVIVFAVSYGHLEYYYINDPVLGKTANLKYSTCN